MTPLTKEEIQGVLHEHHVKHTDACREAPGNKKGTGGHPPMQRHPLDLGGYQCVCDWMDRIRALVK